MGSEKAKWQLNALPKTDPQDCIKILSRQQVEKARAFHASFPQYSRTPLARLGNMAKRLGLGGLYVKDESYRFGLNAFKVLGGSYAVGRYIAQKLGRDISELDFEKITSRQVKDELGDATFFTATDGNHGRGVAWAARQLKQKVVVYMPKGSSQSRLESIRNEGAQVTIEDMNYDDAVRLAAQNAAKTTNGIVVQDTAWEGYTEIPTWIMQGYGTMALEALEQLKENGVERPTHIFVQAGVGSLAAAVQGFFSGMFPDRPPKLTVVEPNRVDCFYRSAVAGDGVPRAVTGDFHTIMAGLACGEPNIIGWEILKNHCAAFVSTPDWMAAKGMRILAVPLKLDDKVISGESGAVTAGLLYEIMMNPYYEDLKRSLELDEDSQVLLFSTEGNTDPEKFRSIVWDGENE